MRICTLISSYETSDSPYKEIDPYPVPERWLPEHTWARELVLKSEVEATLQRLAGEGFDVFVNLCDGAPEEDIAGVEVVRELERLGLPFTGADSRFYALSREEFKSAYDRAGIRSPGYGFASDRATAAHIAERLRFPLFVKPSSGYASIGIERTSLVETPEALLEQVERTAARFGAALIEEYIAGREFTVLAAEPRAGERVPIVYPPVEVCFPAEESFKHFDLKWQEHESMRVRPVDDAGLADRLRRMAEETFLAVGARGYSRSDIRMDADGTLYMIDCNANPGIFYPPGQFGSADFILSLQPDAHRAFLRHIIDCALRAARPRLTPPRTP